MKKTVTKLFVLLGLVLTLGQNIVIPLSNGGGPDLPPDIIKEFI